MTRPTNTHTVTADELQHLMLGDTDSITLGSMHITAPRDDHALVLLGDDDEYLGIIDPEGHMHAPNGVPLINIESMAESVNYISSRVNR